MIGVDTNVLLRLFVNDDARQHAAATAFFAGRSPQSPAFVCHVVLVEFIWSLKRTYGFMERDVRVAVAKLVATSDIELERRELVERSLEVAQAKKTDLPDLLISLGNADRGCSRTLTFDKTAARHVEGMELLA